MAILAMRCPKCGHDPSATILRAWEFTVPSKVHSLNEIKAMNHFKYKKYRDQCEQWIKQLAYSEDRSMIDSPVGKRRLTITRLMTHMQRNFDRDNLVGGCKPIVDACVRAGLARDDTIEDIDVIYEERKAGDLEYGFHLKIEELGEDIGQTTV